jgi:hypothetical protein
VSLRYRGIGKKSDAPLRRKDTIEFNEMVVRGFKGLSARVDRINDACSELLALIDIKRRELSSFLEAIALDGHLD